MHKEEITYVDWLGIERTETYYFNLTRTELTNLDAETPGGMQRRLDAIIKSKDARAIMKEFNGLIDLAYGELSEDGRYHMKSKEALARFHASPAYDLLMQKIFDSDGPDGFASKFCKAILQVEAYQQAPKEGNKVTPISK